MFANPKASNEKPKDKYENLKKFARNLTQLAADGKLDPVIGRSNEVTRVIQILSRKRKNNPILTGNPGVGKTAIAENLAQRIYKKDVPSTLVDCQIWELSLTDLIAGASYRGEYEERLKKVIEEVTASNGEVVLFVDEAHQLISANGDAMDAANILKPALARGDLRMIAATTETEYKLHFEKDPALTRRFAVVAVSEPSVDDTISILRGIKSRYEEHHGVKIKDSALVSAAQLADRYITQRFQPDKSIDLIDIACASVRVQLDSQPAIIDELERKLLQLNVEKVSLEQELNKTPTSPNTTKSTSSTTMADEHKSTNDHDHDDDDDQYSTEQTQLRLQHVIELIKKCEDELNPLKQIHKQARGKVDELQQAKKRLTEVQLKLTTAERDRDTYRIADLKNFALPELQQKIKRLEREVQEEKLASKNLTKDSLISEVVDANQIAEIVSQLTGIPVRKLSLSERKRILTLEQELSTSVIGQVEACKSISDAVVRSRAGFTKKGQPIASFLFCGSTGVGKTEIAKRLAGLLFDNEKNLLRFDMSEYGEQHSVSRLIGAAPGYVGYEQSGQLTEAVRNNPYQVILFDEVEKAHSSIWNIMLQVLDDGRLTDNKGRTVDFSNTIIIFTSNLGSQFLLNSIDVKTGTFKQNLSEVKDKVLVEVKKYFKPEMLNRISELIVFTPLTVNDMVKIVDLQVKELNKRLQHQNIQIEIKPQAVENVIMRSYDPLFGARPIKRWIEKIIVTHLSKAIISGELKPHSKVTIDTNPTVLAKIIAQEKEDKKGGVSFVDQEDLSPDVLTFSYTPLSSEDAKRTFGSAPSSPRNSATISSEDDDDDDDETMGDF